MGNFTSVAIPEPLRKTTATSILTIACYSSIRRKLGGEMTLIIPPLNRKQRLHEQTTSDPILQQMYSIEAITVCLELADDLIRVW
jgi:hypothetical protein